MLAFIQIFIINMQIISINAVNINRRNIKKYKNAVKLLGNVMVYIIKFTRVAKIT